ncbi:MAG: EF-hand domain-containing protein [Sulfuricurvum sp.]|nr:EF-hand domain-containing protein [Sulfuricurvum sp.]
MTVSNNSMLASQLYANKEGQCKRGASDCSPDKSTEVAASFSDIAMQMMAILDTNKSGSIDKSEFSQAAQALAKSSGKTDTSGVDTAFTKADSNNDGQISSDEFMNALKQAADQTQKKHHRHQQQPDVTASNILPQAESNQPSSPMNEGQKNLLNKIMAAYSTPTTVTGSTTNISA